MSSATDVISREDAKAIAASACNGDESIQVLDHRLEPYSKDKVGFLGSHQKLEIMIKRKPDINIEPVKLSFFVKSVPGDSEDQTAFIKQRKVFSQEAAFFNDIMPHLLEATSVGEVEPWAPMCYLANEDVIVLEDVRTKGFKMPEVKVFRAAALKSVARTMAHLHAASVLAEKRLGKRLNELHPKAFVEQIFNEHLQKDGVKMFVSLVKDVVERSGRATIDRVPEIMDGAFEYVRHGGVEQRVVCHGDCWPNNTMLDASEPPNCLLVDYQMVRYAPRAFDLAQLVYLSTNREGRERHEREIIKAYWSELCETLKRCDSVVERPRLEDIVEEYEEARMAALLNAVIYFPTILLSKEVFAEYEGDPETLYRKFVFRPNNDCILEQMDKDEEYAGRITEIALEFVERCEKSGD